MRDILPWAKMRTQVSLNDRGHHRSSHRNFYVTKQKKVKYGGIYQLRSGDLVQITAEPGSVADATLLLLLFCLFEAGSHSVAKTGNPDSVS